MVYQLVELNNQRISTQRAIASLIPKGQAALKVKQKSMDLARDLNETSATEAGAAQIVREAHIQIANPSADNATTPAK